MAFYTKYIKNVVLDRILKITKICLESNKVLVGVGAMVPLPSQLEKAILDALSFQETLLIYNFSILDSFFCTLAPFKLEVDLKLQILDFYNDISEKIVAEYLLPNKGNRLIPFIPEPVGKPRSSFSEDVEAYILSLQELNKKGSSLFPHLLFDLQRRYEGLLGEKEFHNVFENCFPSIDERKDYDIVIFLIKTICIDKQKLKCILEPSCTESQLTPYIEELFILISLSLLRSNLYKKIYRNTLPLLDVKKIITSKIINISVTNLKDTTKIITKTEFSNIINILHLSRLRLLRLFHDSELIFSKEGTSIIQLLLEDFQQKK